VSDLEKRHDDGKTYGHQSVRVVDLNEALNQAGGKLLTRTTGPQDASAVSRSTSVGMKWAARPASRSSVRGAVHCN
jgi:hypothetical protein